MALIDTNELVPIDTTQEYIIFRHSSEINTHAHDSVYQAVISAAWGRGYSKWSVVHHTYFPDCYKLSETEEMKQASELLCEVGLLDKDLIDRANNQHWLLVNLLKNHNETDVPTSPLYKMLVQATCWEMSMDITWYIEPQHVWLDTGSWHQGTRGTLWTEVLA